MAYHDDDCSSDLYQSNDELLSTPDHERHHPATAPTLHSTFQKFKLRPAHTRRRRRRYWPAQRRGRIILAAILIISVVAISLYLTYLTLITTLLTRLSPHSPLPTDVQAFLSTWRGPADSSSLSSSSPSSSWLSSPFATDITPIPCHSHNDYWRPVPLYSALAAGCVGVEADVWLPPLSPTEDDGGDDVRSSSSSSSPLVGHTRRSLRPGWTLRALYVEPLVAMLSAANAGAASANETTTPAAPAGVFETSPATTLVLLLDFKERSAALWEAVQRELAPLRERGWLTYWSEEEGRRRVVRPVTAVVTGEAAFEAVEGLGVKDVFFDAPLERLEGSGGEYNARNSYYASAKLGRAVGRVGLRGLSEWQAGVVRRQVEVAGERGLVSRYWGTPGWPVALRNRVWETLVDNGVGVLNVDELTTASRWDWRFCTTLGVTICN